MKNSNKNHLSLKNAPKNLIKRQKSQLKRFHKREKELLKRQKIDKQLQMTLKVERLVLEIQQKCMIGLQLKRRQKKLNRKKLGIIMLATRKKLSLENFAKKKEERLAKKQSAGSQPKKNTFEKRKPITLVQNLNQF